jgi:hypothetical protein
MKFGLLPLYCWEKRSLYEMNMMPGEPKMQFGGEGERTNNVPYRNSKTGDPIPSQHSYLPAFHLYQQSQAQWW